MSINSMVKWSVKETNLVNKLRTRTSNKNDSDSMGLMELVGIDKSEKLGLIRYNEFPKIPKIIKSVKQYIVDKNLHVDYAFHNGKRIYSKGGTVIHQIHSVGKVFTGILCMLLIYDGTINEKYLTEPIKLDKNVLKLLSKKVVDRINDCTMLEIMTHHSGLLDYLNKYGKSIDESLDKHVILPQPVKPIEFLKFADIDVVDKGYKYSNLGILLLGLYLQYHYNKKHKCHKDYNDILYEYIINKINLKTFSIVKPTKNFVFSDDPQYEFKFVNGSPAGGYWMSCKDLCKFGIFINKLCKNDRFMNIVKKYGGEFYVGGNISHNGYFHNSSALIRVYLNHDTVIAICSNHRRDAIRLNNVMTIFT